MKRYGIGIVISIICILSGCSFGTSVEQQLSDTVSEMYVAEQAYRDAQSELSKLENAEQKLFTEVMELTQEQTEELTAKVVELQQLSDQRLTKIEEEKTSMEEGKSFLKSLDEIIGKVDDENKNEMKELQNAMADRYELHSSFIIEYKSLYSLQKSLYAMLVDETTEMQELQDMVAEVNAQNETVLSTITAFNESTRTVNELKEKVFAIFNEEK